MGAAAGGSEVSGSKSRSLPSAFRTTHRPLHSHQQLLWRCRVTQLVRQSAPVNSISETVEEPARVLDEQLAPGSMSVLGSNQLKKDVDMLSKGGLEMPLKESELSKMSVISAEHVLRLNRVTEDYLCPPRPMCTALTSPGSRSGTSPPQQPSSRSPSRPTLGRTRTTRRTARRSTPTPADLLDTSSHRSSSSCRRLAPPWSSASAQSRSPTSG